MEYGCIGRTLRHSYSRQIHGAIGDYPYELCELTPEDLPSFFARRDFRGINVTVPYKEAVLPFLDAVDPHAAAIGAVNTILCRGGKLTGYNTDFDGMIALLDRGGISLTGRKIAILGTGGTSRTAAAVCAHLGAATVIRVSRTGKENAVTYENFYRQHTDTEILLQTTPVGMFPDLAGCPVDLSRLPALRGVADVIYNPQRTVLLQQAAKRGIPAVGGLTMLAAQGIRAAELFFGRKYPPELLDRVIKTVDAVTENIILIGMPGAGKTTVGQICAQRLRRPFFDTDEEIRRATGRTPANIIREDGVTAFRETEKNILFSLLCRTTGAVIATGGGTVLLQENINRLCQNGRIFFLDRAVDRLAPAGDHPLSEDKKQLESLALCRLPVYRQAADAILPADGTAEDVARAIVAEYAI